MKKNIYLNIFLLVSIVTALSSCVSQKKIAYFQKGLNGADTIKLAQAYIPTIQPGDILAINIGSLNSAASSFFNPFTPAPVSVEGTTQSGSPSAVAQATSPASNLVDVDGNIELPILGPIKVAGLNTVEAKNLIKDKLKDKYLKEPTVTVRFLNYKVSVMGEVARPAVYVIPNEKVTLPEALSMAGDLTIFAKRENVLVIRDNNGTKEFGHVDLTTRDVYSSPYYYLHSNDVIYVEPSKGRVAQTDKVYQLLPVLLSALSLISIIVIYSRR